MPVQTTEFDKARQTKAVERQAFHERFYKSWINNKLKKHAEKVQLVDLLQDLRDGRKLLQLIEVLTGKTLKPVKGNMRLHHINNLTLALDVLKEYNVKLIGIHNNSLADGDQLTTMGLCWHIMYRFQVIEAMKDVGVKNVEKALLEWCQKHTAGYPGVDISTFNPKAWQDGHAFNALINVFCPFDMAPLKKMTDAARLENAFNFAESVLGVYPVFQASDILNDFVDSKTLVIYISTLYARLKDELPVAERGNAEAAAKVSKSIEEESKFIFAQQDSSLLEALTNPTLKDLKKRYKNYSNFFKVLEAAGARMNSVKKDVNALLQMDNVIARDKRKVEDEHSKLKKDFNTLQSNATIAHIAVQTKLVSHLLEQLQQVGTLVNDLQSEEGGVKEAVNNIHTPVEDLSTHCEWCEKTLGALKRMEPLESMLHELAGQLVEDNSLKEDARNQCKEMSTQTRKDFNAILKSVALLNTSAREAMEKRGFKDKVDAWFKKVLKLEVWVNEKILVYENKGTKSSKDLEGDLAHVKGVLTEQEVKWKEFVEVSKVWNETLCDLVKDNSYAHKQEAVQRKYGQLRKMLSELRKKLENKIKKTRANEEGTLEAWKSAFNQKLEEMLLFKNSLVAHPIIEDMHAVENRQNNLKAYKEEFAGHEKALLRQLNNQSESILGNMEVSAIHQQVEDDMQKMDELYLENQSTINNMTEMLSADAEPLKAQETALFNEVLRKCTTCSTWIRTQQATVDQYSDVDNLIKYADETDPVVESVRKQHDQVERALSEGDVALKSRQLGSVASQQINTALVALAQQWDELNDAVDALQGKVAAVREEGRLVNGFKDALKTQHEYVLIKHNQLAEVCRAGEPEKALQGVQELFTELEERETRIARLHAEKEELRSKELSELSVAVVNNEMIAFDHVWQDLNEKCHNAADRLRQRCEQEHETEQHALQEWSRKRVAVDEWLEGAVHVVDAYAELPKDIESMRAEKKDFEAELFKVSVSEKVIDEHLEYGETLASSKQAVKKEAAKLQQDVRDLSDCKKNINKQLNQLGSRMAEFLGEMEKMENVEFSGWMEKANVVKERLGEFEEETREPDDEVENIKHANDALSKHKAAAEKIAAFETEVEAFFVLGRSLITNKKVGRERGAQVALEMSNVEKLWKLLNSNTPAVTKRLERTLSSLQSQSGDELLATRNKIKKFTEWLNFALKQLQANVTDRKNFQVFVQQEQGLKKLSADLDMRSSDFGELVEHGDTLLNKLERNDQPTEGVDTELILFKHLWSSVVDRIDSEFKSLYDRINTLMDENRNHIDSTLKLVRSNLQNVDPSSRDQKLLKSNAAKIKELERELHELEGSVNVHTEHTTALRNVTLFKDNTSLQQTAKDLLLCFDGCQDEVDIAKTIFETTVYNYFTQEFEIISADIEDLLNKRIHITEDEVENVQLKQAFACEAMILVQIEDHKTVFADLRESRELFDDFLTEVMKEEVDLQLQKIRRDMQVLGRECENCKNRISVIALHLMKEQLGKREVDIELMNKDISTVKKKEIQRFSHINPVEEALQELDLKHGSIETDLLLVGSVIFELKEAGILEEQASVKLQEKRRALLEELNLCSDHLIEESERLTSHVSWLQDRENETYISWCAEADKVKQTLECFEEQLREEDDVTTIKNASQAVQRHQSINSDVQEYSPDVKKLMESGNNILNDKVLGKEKKNDLKTEMQQIDEKWKNLNEELPVVSTKTRETFSSMQSQTKEMENTLIERIKKLADWLSVLERPSTENEDETFEVLLEIYLQASETIDNISSKSGVFEEIMRSSDEMVMEMSMNDLDYEQIDQQANKLKQRWSDFNKIFENKVERVCEKVKESVSSDICNASDELNHIESKLKSGTESTQNPDQLVKIDQILKGVNDRLPDLESATSEIGEHASKLNGVLCEEDAQVLIGSSKNLHKDLDALKSMFYALVKGRSADANDYLSEKLTALKEKVDGLKNSRIAEDDPNEEYIKIFTSDHNILEGSLEPRDELTKLRDFADQTGSILNMQDFSPDFDALDYSLKDIQQQCTKRKNSIVSSAVVTLKEDVHKCEIDVELVQKDVHAAEKKPVNKFSHVHSQTQVLQDISSALGSLDSELSRIETKVSSLKQHGILDEPVSKTLSQALAHVRSRSTDCHRKLDSLSQNLENEFIVLTEKEKESWDHWQCNAEAVKENLSIFQQQFDEVDDISSVKNASRALERKKKIRQNVDEYKPNVKKLLENGASILTQKVLGKEKKESMKSDLKGIGQQWSMLNEEIVVVASKLEETFSSMHSQTKEMENNLLQRIKQLTDWLIKLDGENLSKECEDFDELIQTCRKLTASQQSISSKSGEFEEIMRSSDEMVMEMSMNDLDYEQIDQQANQLKQKWSDISRLLKNEIEKMCDDIIQCVELEVVDVRGRLNKTKLSQKSLDPNTQDSIRLKSNAKLIFELQQQLASAEEPVQSLCVRTQSLEGVLTEEEVENLMVVSNNLKATYHALVQNQNQIKDTTVKEIASFIGQNSSNVKRQLDSIKSKAKKQNQSQIVPTFLFHQNAVMEVSTLGEVVKHLCQFKDSLHQYVSNEIETSKNLDLLAKGVEAFEKHIKEKQSSLVATVTNSLDERSLKCQLDLELLQKDTQTAVKREVNKLSHVPPVQATIHELVLYAKTLRENSKNVQKSALACEQVLPENSKTKLQDRLQTIEEKLGKCETDLGSLQHRLEEQFASLKDKERVQFESWRAQADLVVQRLDEFETRLVEVDEITNIKDASQALQRKQSVMSDLQDYSPDVKKLMESGNYILNDKVLGKEKKNDLKTEMQQIDEKWKNLNEELPLVSTKLEETFSSMQSQTKEMENNLLQKIKQLTDWLRANDSSKEISDLFEKLIPLYQELKKANAALMSKSGELEEIMRSSDEMVIEMSINDLDYEQIDQQANQLKQKWSDVNEKNNFDIEQCRGRCMELLRSKLTHMDEDVHAITYKFTLCDTSPDLNTTRIQELGNELQKLDAPVARLAEQITSLNDVTIFADEEKNSLQKSSADLVEQYEKCQKKFTQSKNILRDTIVSQLRERTSLITEVVERLEGERTNYNEDKVDLTELNAFFLEDQRISDELKEQEKTMSEIETLYKDVSQALEVDDQSQVNEWLDQTREKMQKLKVQCNTRLNRVNALLSHLLKERVSRINDDVTTIRSRVDALQDKRHLQEFETAINLLKNYKECEMNRGTASEDLEDLFHRLQDVEQNKSVDGSLVEKLTDKHKSLGEDVDHLQLKMSSVKENLEKLVVELALHKLDAFWGWLPIMQKKSGEEKQIYGPDLPSLRTQLSEIKVIEQQIVQHSFCHVVDDVDSHVTSLLALTERDEVTTAHGEWNILDEWARNRRERLQSAISKWEDFIESERDLIEYLKRNEAELTTWNQVDLNDGQVVEAKQSSFDDITSSMETRRDHVIGLNHSADELLDLMGGKGEEANVVLSHVADVHELWNKLLKQSSECGKKLEDYRTMVVKLEDSIKEICSWISITSSLLSVVNEEMENPQLEVLLLEINEKDGEQWAMRDMLDSATAFYQQLMSNDETRSHFSLTQDVQEVNEEFNTVVQDIENLKNLRGKGKIFWRKLKNNINTAADKTKLVTSPSDGKGDSFFGRLLERTTSLFKKDAPSNEDMPITKNEE